MNTGLKACGGSMASREKITEWLDANPDILRLLVMSETVAEARGRLFDYLNQCEQNVLKSDCPLHPLEQKNVRSCIAVFRNLISEGNERKTGHSCLAVLWEMATEHWKQEDWPDVSDAFLAEMTHLFKGVIGLSGIYSKSGICKREVPEFVHLEGREAAEARSVHLDGKANQYEEYIRKNEYMTGLHPMVKKGRDAMRARILRYLGAEESDWSDYKWHLRHRFQRLEDIAEMISLTDEEQEMIRATTQHRLPFGITPYYLSLMDMEASLSGRDRSLRAQVIPNRIYLDAYLKVCSGGRESLDFMHERDTSPEQSVTRRYAMIAIVKPYLWCPQICVYCQRNWELADEDEDEAQPAFQDLEKAFDWFRSNPSISEVLITGGDPLTVSNEMLEYVIRSLYEIEHIRRIRIGTRTLVTMPMRFDEELLRILSAYHKPPFKTVTMMTHFQHAYEISEETAEAALKLKRAGIDIYNQQVFTLYNSRKFETCFLREQLRSIGITPYYLFNLKGKEETANFKVPVARLLQEQKEEARLLPGTVRTDKPVFNVPTLGKNDLNAWQDHDIVMIHKDGSRIYEFYPWEKYMAPVNTFLFKDEPIGNYLAKLEALGEDIRDYKTIWYYF
ncbi:KamA family radical SAM protein [Paenibacillus zanthoxyli]|uniref:KamA family radical SAM protein n=1 Tax=Paenibacillus zanthoxyli TaxID=369399 RepID=UPI0018DB4171|nr:KamA family radical SAM protein [Paenibacillus zanthoxyli]